MKGCPFCLENDLLNSEIIDREGPCFMVAFRGEVLVDAVMILPLRHVPSPFDLTHEEWTATHVLLWRARTWLDRAEPDGYSVGWNVGEVGGQSVPHAHLHVIARFDDEPMAGQGIRHALKQEANRRPRQ